MKLDNEKRQETHKRKGEKRGKRRESGVLVGKKGGWGQDGEREKRRWEACWR